MVTSYLRKAGSLLKRCLLSVIPGFAINSSLTINKDETIYDVLCEYSKESHVTEITSYICLPCDEAENIKEDTCCSQVGDVSTRLQAQGTNLQNNASLLADLCPSDTVVVDDVVNGAVCYASMHASHKNRVSTVVAESLHLELNTRDSGCLNVETRCETQTQCESSDTVAAPGCSPYLARPSSFLPSKMTEEGPPECAIRERVLPSDALNVYAVSDTAITVPGVLKTANCVVSPAAVTDHSWSTAYPLTSESQRRIQRNLSRWSRLVLFMMLLWVDTTLAVRTDEISCPDLLTSLTSLEPTPLSDVRVVSNHVPDPVPPISIGSSVDRISGIVTQSVCHETGDELNKIGNPPEQLKQVTASTTVLSDSALDSLSSQCGEPWLEDTALQDEFSLWERVKLSVPGIDEPHGTTTGTSGSDDWFHGKMPISWFHKYLVCVDHSDGRSRRDWSKKESEICKGPNRFAKQWAQFMSEDEYSDTADLPYDPDCQFGRNVSSDRDIQRQRSLALAYCEYLKSYIQVWTKLHGRHPVAGVLFSGSGIMVRGMLWMGIRCIMIDYDPQLDALQ